MLLKTYYHFSIQWPGRQIIHLELYLPFRVLKQNMYPTAQSSSSSNHWIHFHLTAEAILCCVPFA